MERICDKLTSYSASDFYGFHMPGHKRQNVTGAALPYEIDITEIDGFDDLHHPDGILKESQQKAGELYGADTRYLVNGSTAGILSAILGCTDPGDTILVARNCHKSVYHAVTLGNLQPIYLYPDYDPSLDLNTEISAHTVTQALASHPEAKAIVVVSPTYDGVISDIRRIADLAHGRKIPLIVDEAHGAHLGMHPYFPGAALQNGADVVIHSIHKTLPSLTQTALISVQGEYINKEKIYRYLDMLQSSSPSYVLMASIDACIRFLASEKEVIFDSYVKRLKKLREELRDPQTGLKHLGLLETEHYDRSKVVISTAGADMSGRELMEILREEFHLELEMAAGSYCIAMTSPADTEEGFTRLKEALLQIDARMNGPAGPQTLPTRSYRKTTLPKAATVLTIAEALRIRDTYSNGTDCDGRPVQNEIHLLPWTEATGFVSLEYAYLYPPGCPVIVPGEVMTEEAAKLLERYDRQGFRIEGLTYGKNLLCYGKKRIR